MKLFRDRALLTTLFAGVVCVVAGVITNVMSVPWVLKTLADVVFIFGVILCVLAVFYSGE